MSRGQIFDKSVHYFLRFAVAEKLIFRHVNSRLHVGNLRIQDRYPPNIIPLYKNKGGVNDPNTIEQ